MPLAELWYNTSFHTALGCSPFKVLYGYDPPIVVVPLVPDDTDEDVAKVLADRALITNLLKEQLAAAQNCMKLQLIVAGLKDISKWEIVFLLKLQPYAHNLVVNRSCPKLALKFFGPYQVIEKVGAYKLDLLGTTQVHHIFHVS